MTNQPGSTPTDDASAKPYDASTDPDSDPSMLNPREGAAAADDASSDTAEDPDSDPDQLNPRGA